MASRMKEDEKNEKIIRGLLRLPGNKRCINCNCLGPQYVCTNFWTFVCTTCSGIHREFTHRVKSISMAKFTSQEVTALQGAGNERAREIFFKEWDPQRHYLPDSSNIERLRDFIRHVYVDRRYTGDKSTDRPPRTKMGDREIAGENKRTDTYRGGSRSPPYEDTYDHRYDDRSNKNSSGERSPAYDQDYRRSPHRDTYDDRQKDDRFGKGPQMRSDDRQNGPPKPEGRSPNYQKEMDFPSPPMIRPVRDILGEDVPPLRVGEPPKANGRRATDAPLHPQRTASSSSMGSTDGNSVELKRVNSGSLIDFNADPEPPVSAVPRKNTFSDQLVQQQPAITPPSSDSSNWASFGLPTQEKAPTAPSNAANTLVSQLSQLSTPATAFVDPMSGGGSIAPQAPNASNTFESAISLLSAPATSNVGHMSTLHSQSQQSSLFQVAESRPTFQQFSSPFVGIPNNQPWTSLAPNVVQGPSVVPPLGQSYLPAPNRLQERSALEQPPALAETKSSGRQELPENLFAASYGPPPVHLQRWQSAPPYAMGYGLQHPSTMLQSMPSFPQSQRSTNPFDLSGEPTPVQTHTFPSLSSIQGALPNIAAPSAQLRPSTFGTPSPQWPPQPPSYISALPQGQHMVHQAPTNTMTLGYQATGGFGSAAPQPGGFSQPPNSFSSFGGNPFG